MDKAMTTGQQFRKLRKSAGINQTKLSEMSCVGRSTIWRFETGKYDIKLFTLEKLLNEIGVKIILIDNEL